jgi:transcription-repair coupling factor (superfamily II helicase)
MLEEITDRFGKLPPQGQTLFDVHRLRVLAQALRRDRRSMPRRG